MLDRIKAKLHLDDSETKSQAPVHSHTDHTCVNPAHLFPVPVVRGFSTLPDRTIPNVASVPLADEALGIGKATPGFSRRTICVDGLDTFEASYPEGSINPQGNIKGGFGCYLERAEFEQARDVLFSYAIKFEDGFDFVKGGKLPGLCKPGVHVEKVG